MLIKILSMHNDNYKAITKYTIPNKEEYVGIHKYPLCFDDCCEKLKVQTHRDELNTRKMTLVIQTLKDSNCDWICWIDADALIMNMKIKLEDFIDEDFDFIIGEDWNGINSGIFFLRVCDSSLNFMQKSFEYIPTKFDMNNTPNWWWPSEQCAYTRCISLLRTKIVHHSLFNGYIITRNTTNNYTRQIGNKNFIDRQFQHGDFILHFPGFNKNMMLPLLEKYSKEIIR